MEPFNIAADTLRVDVDRVVYGEGRTGDLPAALQNEREERQMAEPRHVRGGDGGGDAPEMEGMGGDGDGDDANELELGQRERFYALNEAEVWDTSGMALEVIEAHTRLDLAILAVSTFGKVSSLAQSSFVRHCDVERLAPMFPRPSFLSAFVLKYDLVVRQPSMRYAFRRLALCALM